jgi:hypothetical protein
MSIATGICNDSLVGTSIYRLQKGSEVYPDYNTDETYRSRMQIFVSIAGGSKFVSGLNGTSTEYVMVKFLDKILYVNIKDLHLISEKEIFYPE